MESGVTDKYVSVASRNRTLAQITVLRKWPIKFTERKSLFFRRPKVATSSYWWKIVAYSLLAKGRNAKKRRQEYRRTDLGNKLYLAYCTSFNTLKTLARIHERVN